VVVDTESQVESSFADSDIKGTGILRLFNVLITFLCVCMRRSLSTAIKNPTFYCYMYVHTVETSSKCDKKISNKPDQNVDGELVGAPQIEQGSAHCILY
jgi:hypothetical protein